MERHEISTQMGVSRVESSTSHRLTPLSEMGKWISGDRDPGQVHGELLAADAAVEPDGSRPSEATKVASETPSAQLRLTCGEDRGMTSAARNPASGRNKTRVSRFIGAPPRGSVLAMNMATIATTEPNRTQVA